MGCGRPSPAVAAARPAKICFYLAIGLRQPRRQQDRSGLAPPARLKSNGSGRLDSTTCVTPRSLCAQPITRAAETLSYYRARSEAKTCFDHWSTIEDGGTIILAAQRPSSIRPSCIVQLVSETTQAKRDASRPMRSRGAMLCEATFTTKKRPRFGASGFLLEWDDILWRLEIFRQERRFL